MPTRLRSKRKDYNLVDDGHDSRIPMHNEEAFKHGIHFKSKYIGTLDVPRPTGRMEIVVAMRRIRYEFKAKAIKKKKVDVIVSVDGVKVMQRKKKKKQMWAWDLDRLNIMNDPIYRIFYVSHDSHDLKIWSYIARDGQSNVFRCNVFKSPKKSQAMQVVRTIGQAFEVSHKLSAMGPAKKNVNKEDETDKTLVEDTKTKESDSKKDDGAEKIKNDSASDKKVETPKTTKSASIDNLGSGTLSAHHKMQLVQQQLQQAEQQAQVALAQVHLLKDQLAAETAARIESQARSHQLLLQNKDQIDQMAKLVQRISALEKILNEKLPEGVDSISLLQETGDITSSELLLDISTPAPGAVHIPALADIDMSKDSPFMDIGLFANTNTTSKSNGGLSFDLPNGDLTLTPPSSELSRKTMEESSSSSEDEDVKLSNGIQHWPNMQHIKNSTRDSMNTSVWTSGMNTPENRLNNLYVDTPTNNNNNMSNGYTLSPILDTSDHPESLFQHFSLLDSEDPPKYEGGEETKTSQNEDSVTANIMKWENQPLNESSPSRSKNDEEKLPSTNSSISLISAPPQVTPRSLNLSSSNPAFRKRPNVTPKYENTLEPINVKNTAEPRNSNEKDLLLLNTTGSSESYHNQLSKSQSFESPIFSSPEQYDLSMKYEPLRKEVAADHTNNLLNTRLNASFSVGDGDRKPKQILPLNKSYTMSPTSNVLAQPPLKHASAFSPDFSAIMDFSVQDSSFETPKNDLFIDEESLKSNNDPSNNRVVKTVTTLNDKSTIQSLDFISRNSMDNSSGSSPEISTKNQSSGFDSGVADETGTGSDTH